MNESLQCCWMRTVVQMPDHTGGNTMAHYWTICRLYRGIHSVECLELVNWDLALHNGPLGGNVVAVAQVHSPLQSDKYLVASDRRYTPATTGSCRTTRSSDVVYYMCHARAHALGYARQVAMLCRIGNGREVRLLCTIVGGEVA